MAQWLNNPRDEVEGIIPHYYSTIAPFYHIRAKERAPEQLYLNYFLQFAEARRNQQIEQLTKERKQQHSYQMVEWKKRYLEKQNEATRRAHEDSVKHLQVTVCFSPG